MTNPSRRVWSLLSYAAIAACSWAPAVAQDSTIVLPAPTGTQLWSPAERPAAFARASNAPGVDPSGSDYGRLLARVATHASWQPPFEPVLPPAPLVVFSTGRSMGTCDDTSLGYDAEGVYRETGAHARSRYTAVIVKGAGHNTFTDLLLGRKDAALRSVLVPYPEVEVQTTFALPTRD